MNDQVKPASRPLRRCLRFSVRGLIVAVLVIGAWLGWIVRSARIQREAVAAITKAGGTVTYDWEWKNGKSTPGGKPWAPKRLVDLLGVDYFGHVTQVAYPHRLHLLLTRIVQLRAELAEFRSEARGNLQSPAGATATRPQPPKAIPRPMPDGTALAANLSVLTKVSSVDLSGTNVTDEGLAHLKPLIRLSELNLAHTQITDSGLAHLGGLTNLSVLDASNTKITDAGLVHLTGLKSLSKLNLAETQITDAGLARLRLLMKLSLVNLWHTHVTDAGAGLGEGGGLYLADGGIVYIDMFTSAYISGNTASTSDNDIFGIFTIC